MKTIVVFSHLRWNFVFQRPQHLLTRLSKDYRIVFVEEPMRTEGGPYMYSTVAAPNIHVLVPHTNEEGWGFNDKQLVVMGKMTRDWLTNFDGITEGYGIWFYTPQALPMKDVLSPEFIVFDVMDELSLFKGAPESLKVRETELLKIADVVIAGGPSLYAAKKLIREDIICLPSSVDKEHYSPNRAEEVEAIGHEDDKLEHDIPHPRLGFVGVIDERLDIDLITAIAAEDPHWHVVMVGPVVKIDPATLPQAHNIHWLGQQDYAILPQIVHTWDVCLLPFALNDSTKFISPTKTLEYMAAEKPIVSTDIHDVVELYGDVVLIGKSHAQFIDAIKLILSEEPAAREDRIKRGLEIVSRSSWDTTAEKVHQAIEDALNRKDMGRINLGGTD